ncbi:hypothetical protein EVAR_102062_1 [Eumeta japonica]|uniref:DDE Tnp4 domain-containing protein n=1 Tax=Eumeta variegata TaxID=151549 RepID=A0A4C1U0C9_EUMVA|nr:hypothetical protein EVAR_102062_1 [Eumeta japonica]
MPERTGSLNLVRAIPLRSGAGFPRIPPRSGVGIHVLNVLLLGTGRSYLLPPTLKYFQLISLLTSFLGKVNKGKVDVTDTERIRHYWIRYVNRKLAVYRRYSRRMDAVVLYWYYRRRRKIRRYWQYPLMAQRSREGAYSLLMSQLRAIVDSDYRFIYVSVGSYGKECDSSIFKETTFWKMMLDDSLQIPAPCPLTRDSETRVPYVVIGDEGFGLHENLLRPFGETHLDKNKRIFNYRLTRAGKYVECAFGILANK